MLAEAGAIALAERDDGVRRRLRPGVEGGLRVAHRQRRAVAVALQPDEAAGRLDAMRSVAGAMRERPVLPPGRDRGVDQRGVQRAHVLVAQPERCEVARRVRLDQHVAARDQRAQATAISLVLEINGDAALAEGDRRPVERVALPVGGLVEGRARAAGVAAGRLDRDHLGAEVRQHPPGERALHGREVDDADAVEGAGHQPSSRAIRSPSS